jgi:ribosomal RNA-processing protein 17
MNNLAHLTRSHKAIAAKKRAKHQQIAEVTFNETARLDYLTGFHKRKVARTQAAKKKAEDREKQERQEMRREQRRALREQATENAAQVEAAYGNVVTEREDSEEDEWGGVIQGNDAAYEGEETLANVTVVEDFDPQELLRGPSQNEPGAHNRVHHGECNRETVTNKPPKKASTISKKRKNVKTKYGTKDGRKFERSKQLARRTEKAERAGGKASRKKQRR